MPTARFRSLILALPLLILAACNGGDDGGSAATTLPAATVATTSPPTTVPATTAPPTAASTAATTVPATTVPATAPATAIDTATTAPLSGEAAIASSALIVLDDFVEGWVASPRVDDDEEDARMVAMIGECADVDPVLIGEELMGDTKAQSPEFASPDDNFDVEHTVGFAPDETTAAAAMAAIGDPDLPGCYASAISTLFGEMVANPDPTDSLPPGLEVGQVISEVGDLSELGLAAEGHWYHITVPLSLDGETVEQHGDVVFLRNGRAVAQVSLGGFGAPFPLEDLGPIVQLADAKLATIA